MNEMQKGFTLIEMMVAISISVFILGTTAVSLRYADKVYRMSNSRNELTSKAIPLEKRLEIDLKNGAPAAVIGVVRGQGFTAASATYSGVIINTQTNQRFIYWWDKNGNGDVIAGANFFQDIGNPPMLGAVGSTGSASTSIYRAQINTGTSPWSIMPNTTIPIIISKGKVPAGPVSGPLQGIYNGIDAWNNTPIKITDFRITFLTTDANQRTTIWVPPNFNTIRYMKIEITTVGNGIDDTQRFSTGFSFP